MSDVTIGISIDDAQANADLAANEISESKIDFDTACAAGSYLRTN